MSWITGLPQPPSAPPCKVLPNPDEFKYCGRPSGGHTALDVPVCDECWDAIREP